MADFPGTPVIQSMSELQPINRRKFEHAADGTIRGIDAGRGAAPVFNIKIVYAHIGNSDLVALRALIEADIGNAMGLNFHDGETYSGYVDGWTISRHSAGT